MFKSFVNAKIALLLPDDGSITFNISPFGSFSIFSIRFAVDAGIPELSTKSELLKIGL